MSNDQITPQEVIDFMRDKLKDEFSTLTFSALRESDTREDLIQRITAVLNDLHEEGQLKPILPEEPKFDLECTDKEKFKYEVKPLNETAKRLIQMMNLQMPEMRR